MRNVLFSKQTFFGVAALVAFGGLGVSYGPGFLTPPRKAWQENRLPNDGPSENPVEIVAAFGGLKLEQPVDIVPIPNSKKFIVLQRIGKLQVISPTESGYQATEAVDFTDRASWTEVEDDGALCVALHPKFTDSTDAHFGECFVMYTARDGDKKFNRLSKFKFDEKLERADPQSETILINQVDGHVWHNGGSLAFDQDGFLFVGVGDEGENDDGLKNGQKLDGGLFAGMLRIDVDMRGGEISHPIKRQPKNGTTQNYYIPNDNPFITVPNGLEEFYAIGLRNPHRITLDPKTGKLWCAEVGHLSREQVLIIEAGGNYGWSYREGTLPFRNSYLQGRRPHAWGKDTLPYFEYAHASGNTCIIGGVVYHGKKFAWLDNSFIYADYGTNRVFSVSTEDPRQHRQIAALRESLPTGIVSVRGDHDGELLFVSLGVPGQANGSFWTIEAIDPSKAKAVFPAKLSETGIFNDLETLELNRSFVPYDVNSPLWSDGADKYRWISLPGRGRELDPKVDRIEFSATGSWKFPSGTVFVKHFEIATDARFPESKKRLETRVLVRDSSQGVYGMTYRWNDEETDAFLVEATTTDNIQFVDIAGNQYERPWVYPGSQDCYVCHNSNSGYVLGISSKQLNRPFKHPSYHFELNQIDLWSRMNMFTESVSSETLETLPALVKIDDPHVRLEDRVRSYLDANCSSCHRPGGARAKFDARFETPLAEQGLLDGELFTQEGLEEPAVVVPGQPHRSMLIHRLMHHSKRMPPIGVQTRDNRAIAVISDWIDRLDDSPVRVETNPAPPADTSEGGPTEASATEIAKPTP